MYKLELQWKEFNVSLEKIDKDLRDLYPSYVGNQAHSVLELWFNESLSQEQESDIKDIWESISEESDEAKSYRSAEQIQEEQKAKKESAKAKLAALGLDADELKALLG